MFKKNKIHDFSTFYKIKESVPSLINSALVINGNIETIGAIEILGKVFGNITAEAIYLREGSIVKGNIQADYIKIKGSIEGVAVAKRVAICSEGKINGNIKYGVLSVESGAVIDGYCKKIPELMELESNKKVSTFLEDTANVMSDYIAKDDSSVLLE